MTLDPRGGQSCLDDDLDESEPGGTTYSLLAPFCGSGPGALGFQQAEMRLAGLKARFRVVGGIDIDPAACEDFTYLTKAPALCADISTLTVEQLVAFAGKEAPDCVFSSPPCVGHSTLISGAKSLEAKYQDLNNLVLSWTELMMGAWGHAPPRLFLIENVPNIARRGSKLLDRVKDLLREHGYAFHQGFHDCGELGGLAQRRKRFLLVARHKERLPQLLYQPPKRKVRGCGEVIGTLPLPGTRTAGPMHALPAISTRNWLRLALIPAGGDWSKLAPAIEALSKPRTSMWSDGAMTLAPWAESLHAPDGGWYRGTLGVVRWSGWVGCVTGNARHSTGSFSVADERLGNMLSVGDRPRFNNVFVVTGMSAPVGAINGGTGPSSGAPSLADDRLASLGGMPKNTFSHALRVTGWESAIGTVTAARSPQNGAPSVADLRLGIELAVGGAYKNTYGVCDPTQPTLAITGAARPSCGAFSFADPALRVKKAFGDAYGVCVESDPAPTIIGESLPPNGAFTVADGRLGSELLTGDFHPHTYGVLALSSPAHAITAKACTGSGPFSVADERLLGRARAAGGNDPAPTERRGRAQPRPTAKARRRGEPSSRPRRRGAGMPPAIVILTPDPRVPNAPSLKFRFFVSDMDFKPPFVPYLPAVDGTWHRPFTTLELALLQGFPATIDGRPLKLSGNSATAWRKRIGNAVPPPTSCAIAEKMLATLLGGDMGSVRSGSGAVWVSPRRLGWRNPTGSVWDGAREIRDVPPSSH